MVGVPSWRRRRESAAMQRITNASWIEDTTVGRIVIPQPLPEGFALFYTTADFAGRTDEPELIDILRDRFGIDATLATCTQVHGRVIGRAEARPTLTGKDGPLHVGPAEACLISAGKSSSLHVGSAEALPISDDKSGSPHVGRASARPSECDALFTAERGIALGIKIADCLPVSLCDPAHRVIANIHTGWRGAAQRITAETLDTLARETAFDPRSVYAYLGPSIRVCCFEVGEEVAAQFDAAWIDRGRGVKPHLDIVAMTDALLRERGVANVIDTGLCTRCGAQPLFHSYRRDKRSGRNLAIAAQ